jgi:prevent-host-death family protein
MKTVSARNAKNEFGALLSTVQKEPVIVTKHNRPVAFMMSFDAASSIPKYRAILAARMAESGPGPDIGPYIGAAKGNFTTPEEVDAFIRRERDLWG